MPPDAAADAALADLPASTLVIRLSSEGRITSLENWEALRDESLAIVRAKLQGQKSGEDLEAALARARALFATHEQVTAVFTRSVAMLFYPIGLSISAGEVVESDDWVENPFGGERLPTTTFLKAAPEDDNHCRVTLDTHFQDEAFLIVQNSIAEYAQRADRGAAPPPARFSIEDHSEFIVDRKAGWVQQAEFSRTIISDDSRRVDRRQWTLAPSAAPAPLTKPSPRE